MADASQSVLALKGAGTALSTVGSFNQASTQQGVLNYESQVAGNNAIYADYQASVAKQVGEQQVQASELRTTQLAGAESATLAANGVALGAGPGTAQDILASTKYMGARDALTIQDNTNRRAWALGQEQQNFRNEGALDQALSQRINPLTSAGSSLLTGAGSVAQSWYRLKQSGATGGGPNSGGGPG
jgi:hypothetical protein